MSLIKFNERFPLSTSVFDTILSTDNMFNDNFFVKNSLMPAINVKENDKDFVIELAAPGFLKEDFEIAIDNNELHISAAKKTEKEEENYLCKEFSYDSFKRSLRLPENINLDKNIIAHFKNGVLTMKMLKKEEKKVTSKKVVEIS
ncbi:Hsp20/alpha crystallin family protein [Aureibaculum marinum]|uniref:Hsp20/alpha crystallin family protein n=2 Tax=Aureibaculum marinum TaxID=2487930 RepID=A0A3N4P2C7_9FLAO|nr:Hsp20/alpha crystallin family protein [Aureibaculum marinum]